MEEGPALARSRSWREEDMSRKIRKDDKYSGLRPDGKPFPEVLVGLKELAAYLRRHPETVGRWIREGRLPAPRDGKGRRWTTKGIIDRWALLTYKTELEKERAESGVKREARRNLMKDGAHPRPFKKPAREDEGRDRSLLRCGAQAWQACPVNPDARHSMECYPICPYCLASDGSHAEHCPAVHGRLAS